MLEIKLLPGSEVEIVGEISVDDFGACRSQALKELSEKVKIDGFRPGKIPEKILVENIGEQEILEKMATIALQKEYPQIIVSHKIRAIGRPLITITKIAANNPLGFKIRTFIMPEIELPDYKKIKILEKIVEATKMDIPKILIDAENGDTKRVKYGLVLNEIAEREKIEVSEEELNKETEKTMELYKNLDKEQVKMYTYGIIRNKKVFKLLESC